MINADNYFFPTIDMPIEFTQVSLFTKNKVEQKSLTDSINKPGF